MASQKKQGKGGSNKILIILVVVIGLVVLGVGSFFGFKIYMNKKANVTAMPIKESYYELGEFMVKLNDEGGKRFLKTKVALTFDSTNKDLLAEIEEKNLAIRDSVNFYFMSKNVADFKPENEVALKKGLVDKVNGLLTEGKVIDVKFSELITQ